MPLPLIIGGALAAGGAVGNWMANRQNAKTLGAAYDRIAGLGDQAQAANAADIANYRQQLVDTYGAGANSYNEALQNFLNSPVYQNEGFAYTGNIDQFVDPAINQRMDAVNTALANSAATGGNRFSSDYMNNLSARNAAMASEEWEKAYNRLMQDRQQQMSEWNANSQNAWNNYNAQNTRNTQALDIYGNDRNQLMQGSADAIMAHMNNRNANLQTQAQAIAGKANAQQGTSGWDLFGGLTGAGARFMSGYFGG